MYAKDRWRHTRLPGRLARPHVNNTPENRVTGLARFTSVRFRIFTSAARYDFRNFRRENPCGLEALPTRRTLLSLSPDRFDLCPDMTTNVFGATAGPKLDLRFDAFWRSTAGAKTGRREMLPEKPPRAITQREMYRGITTGHIPAGKISDRKSPRFVRSSECKICIRLGLFYARGGRFRLFVFVATSCGSSSWELPTLGSWRINSFINK